MLKGACKKGKTTITIVCTVVVFCIYGIVPLIPLISQESLISITSESSEVSWKKTDKTEPYHSSIAFYTIVGASHGIEPDLRGKFWEFQLEKHPTLNASLEYLSDGPLKANGIEFMVLPEGSGSYTDQRLCIRTSETWKHFKKFHSDKKWYFRGTHDTFVNVTALLELIRELEKKGDPMKDYLYAYNCHEYNYVLYPQGGTGWLMSNYAIQKFVDDLDYFNAACSQTADDIALTSIIEKHGQHVKDWMTEKFIVTWPNHQGDIIYQNLWGSVPKCPEYYYLYNGAPPMKPCPARTAVSIHMHRVPMNQAWEQLSMTPPEYGVTFKDPNTPEFCRL